MRVGIVAFLQESNTFAPGQTTLADFEADLLLTGETVRERLASAHHEVAGFFSGLSEDGLTAVPILAARAVPWGAMTDSTLQEICRRLVAALTAAGRLDGLLVAAHGATVSQDIPDVDGFWLSELRRLVGPDVPIIGTLDPHANLSPRMVESCNALIAYRTNPHLDQYERGREAARLIVRTLRGEIRPRQAAAYPPLSISIECQSTAEPPCRELFEQLEAVQTQPRLLAASALLGFPYADVPEMGSATLVVADSDQQLAQREADRLAAWMWQRREGFVRAPVSVESAVLQAANRTGPVCLLDIGDNVGGGGPADATYLALALRRTGVRPALVCLNDPDAASMAHGLGTGGTLAGSVGGKSCPLSGPPIGGPFRVLNVTTGKFSESQPRHGGFVDFDQGPTAVLETTDGLTIIVTSRRTPPFSLGQVTSCGLEPGHFQAIVAKGVHAPLAAYRHVCREFIRVDTPGVTTADVTRLDYRFRHRPMFPFERDCPGTFRFPCN